MRGGPRPGSGRPKGVQNKVTVEAKALFAAMFERNVPEVERWIKECAEGVPAVLEKPDGTKLHVRQGADPGKAADLMLRMAEFHIPKLQRVERGIADFTDEEFLAEARRRAALEVNGHRHPSDGGDGEELDA